MKDVTNPSIPLVKPHSIPGVGGREVTGDRRTKYTISFLLNTIHGFVCRCGHVFDFIEPSTYPHKGGAYIDYDGRVVGPVWIFWECPECKYQWSLPKIVRLKYVGLEKLVEVIDPFIPGVNHYVTAIWLGENGWYYITSRKAYVSPNGPGPVEYVYYDTRRIIAGPFNSPEEARKWFYNDEDDE